MATVKELALAGENSIVFLTQVLFVSTQLHVFLIQQAVSNSGSAFVPGQATILVAQLLFLMTSSAWVYDLAGWSFNATSLEHNLLSVADPPCLRSVAFWFCSELQKFLARLREY